jgi:hypothetical protein
MFLVAGAVDLSESLVAGAIVSPSFIAIRAKTSRISRAAAIGSGLT